MQILAICYFNLIVKYCFIFISEFGNIFCEAVHCRCICNWCTNWEFVVVQNPDTLGHIVENR